MGKSLYRSYRSKNFDEIIGQEHVTTTLKNALKSNAISHAYLLSGPRGTGKTSVARILAYAVNDQPYEIEGINLDIIEIDAASNRRIDEIREIRDRVHIAPTVGKYKIYIIDEVHMLTREAFNALLKTLEEPPEHVIFILATTETHKVPETILSRCIRLNFKPINPTDIAKHLEMIATKEKITIKPDAIALLAEHARGSFRDAISLLEQVKYLSSPIERQHVASMLGLASEAFINSVVESLEKRDVGALAKLLQEIASSGANIGMFCSQLQAKLRDILIKPSSTSLKTNEVLQLQKNLLLVPGSSKPQIELEVCLYQVALAGEEDDRESVLPPPKAESKTAEVSIKKTVSDTPKKVSKTSAATPTASKPVSRPKPDQQLQNSTLWEECLTALKGKNNTLYGIARMASVSQNDNEITLTFKFAFHEKQINDPKNKALFSQLLSELHGSPITLTTMVDKNALTPTNKPADDILENVSNIFGAHEVLES